MKKGIQISEKIPAANRQYKDTVFRMLFSEKENLLSLYNAVTGSHYQNAEALKIVTLENAIYMGMKNDLAFIMDMNLYLYDGPVMEFDNCVANRWTASTRAVSEKKARSNLTYQFKKKNNRLPGTKIILPGKISLVSGKETT